MPQVSLYVDDETMGKLRQDAKREGVSLPKHVASRLKANDRYGTSSGLPEDYFRNLYGFLSGDDSFVRPPQLDYSLDVPRSAFE